MVDWCLILFSILNSFFFLVMPFIAQKIMMIIFFSLFFEIKCFFFRRLWLLFNLKATAAVSGGQHGA